MTEKNKTPQPVLDRQSHGNLDVRIKLIPHSYGVTLAFLSILGIVVIVWSLLGTIPIRATGTGIIVLANQEILSVESLSPGVLRAVAVREGEAVASGDVLAQLDQTDLEIAITSARNAVMDIKESNRRLAARMDAQKKQRQSNFGRQSELLSASIADLETENSKLKALLDDDKTKTVAEEFQNRIAYQNSLGRIVDLKTSLLRAEQELDGFNIESQTIIQNATRELNLKQRELEGLIAQRQADVDIRAPIGGHVQEIRVSSSQNVTTDQILMTIVHGTGGSEVIGFLEPDQATRVEIGMPVQVTPRTVEKAEYGAIKGDVIFVSQTPISSDYADYYLANEELAKKLTANGTTYLVKISLEANLQSINGYNWWNGEGPPFKVAIGTLAEIDVILATQSPVSLVIPALSWLKGG